MASRRMFSKDVVCSDRFLDMPASAQALYFQYGLEADDDGFVSAPKKILRLTNASDDDLKILVAKGFLIPFDSGVVVIRDWKINNYLRRDRYTPTRFKEEFEQLDTIDDRYQLHVLAVGIPDDNHVVDMRDTQVRLGKDSIGKGSINNNVGRKMSHFTPPTVEEVQEYCFERGNAVDAQSFVDFVGYVKSPINSIIRFINNFLYAIQTMQNSFANALNSMSISLPHWLEKLTGFSSVGFNVGYWSAPMVPYLAQGAVIPPNKEFMAVLGDQKSGNNIEAPESLIRRIVREESGNGKGSTYNVTAQVNRRTLFDLVLEEGKVRRTVTGRNPFETV